MGLLSRIKQRLSALRLKGLAVLNAAVNRSGFMFVNNTLASNETIFSAISMLSGAMASLPISLRGHNSVKIKSVDHYVAEMMEHGPNPNMTAFEFIRCMEVLRNSTGAGYALRELDKWGRTAALWPLRSEHVSPRVDKETRELYFHIRDPDCGDDVYIHNSYVVAVTHISDDGVNPVNPINVLQSSLDYDREVKEFSVEQMQNGLRAKYTVTFPKELSKEQLDAYDEQLRRFRKSGVLYLDTGKVLEELKGADFIDPKVFEVEKITIARVARVYNIPLEKFIPELSKYSSAEQSDLIYLRDTILPTVRMYEQEFTKKLLSPQERAEGMKIKFSFNGFARADMQTRGEFYQKGIRSGWLCVDDIRELEDSPPLPDNLGQVFYISKDLIPVHMLEEYHKNQKGSEVINQDERITN